MHTLGCLAGPSGATHRHEDEWSSVRAWENIGATQLPMNPLSQPTLHPRLKGQRNFLSKVAAQTTLPKQVPTKTFKSWNHRFVPWWDRAPFQQRASHPAEWNCRKVREAGPSSFRAHSHQRNVEDVLLISTTTQVCLMVTGKDLPDSQRLFGWKWGAASHKIQISPTL